MEAPIENKHAWVEFGRPRVGDKVYFLAYYHGACIRCVRVKSVGAYNFTTDDGTIREWALHSWTDATLGSPTRIYPSVSAAWVGINNVTPRSPRNVSFLGRNLHVTEWQEPVGFFWSAEFIDINKMRVASGQPLLTEYQKRVCMRLFDRADLRSSAVVQGIGPMLQRRLVDTDRMQDDPHMCFPLTDLPKKAWK